MKKSINRITIVLLMAFAAACVDESLDPVKFKEVKKATMLALRGSAFDNLNNTGCSNGFFKNSATLDPANEIFTYDADFLAEDQETLQEVQVFAAVVTTTNGGLTARPRAKVATIPGSAFTFPTDSKTKRGNVSAKLSDIMTALNISVDSLVKLNKVTNSDGEVVGTADITMTADLVLTDGSIVLASSLVNDNLFQSVVFYPAHVLTYCANDQEDFRPVATTSLLGTWGLTTDGKKVSRTKIPSLKSGASDTLYITYDNPIINDIADLAVAFSPNTAGTATALVKAKEVDANGFYTDDDSDNGFYLVYTANGSYTGAVTATVTGAIADIGGVELEQNPKKQTINVDNTAPIRISTSTGTRIGAGQFVTMKVTFNEKLSTKSANAIKVTVDGTATGLETVTAAKMTVASDGLSASLIYIFKLAVPTVPATHGSMAVVFTDAIDEAGNTTVIPNGTLTVDVGIPPAPTLETVLVLGTYDQGTQISWKAAQATGGANPGGSISGKEYFIAITAGKPRPTAFSVDLDGVATWTMPVDPASTDVPPAKVSIMQSGTVTVTDGASANPAYTAFTANGTFDIYAVFVSSSNTISAISVAAPVAAPGPANPLTVIMN